MIKITDKFLDLLYPKGLKCYACGRELSDGMLCNDCGKRVHINVKYRCIRCNRPLWAEAKYCGMCKEHKYFWKAVRSPLVYSGVNINLIRGFKFGNKKYLADYFGKVMASAYKAWEKSCNVIVPVPLHETAFKARGYNQCELLAETLSPLVGLPVSRNLIKMKKTEEQAKLAYRERMTNLEGAFIVPDKHEFKGKTILLIDDVFTTGATGSECARVMKKAGAADIYMLTAAVTEYKLPLE